MNPSIGLLPMAVTGNRKKAAIPYYGGKFRMARYIVPIIESIPHTTYIEPCIGGASVFLWRDHDPSKVEVINDINIDIYAMYKAFKLYPKSVLKLLDSIPYSIAAYREYSNVKVTKPVVDMTRLELVTVGVAAYFRVCTTFGNMPSVSSMNIDPKGSVNFPKRWKNKKVILRSVIDRFSDVHIDNRDLMEMIEKWDDSKALFYIDPPYPETRCDGFENDNFDMESYIRLCDLLDGIKGSFIMSCYDNGIKPLSVMTTYRKSIRNTLSDTKKPSELIYVKWGTALQAPHIDGLELIT